MMLIEKWFWLACVVCTCLNARGFQAKSREKTKVNSELEEGYRRLTKGYLFWGNLPWIVMGVGLVFGKVPSLDSYLHPREGNVFVLAFYISVFSIWLLGTYWLLFRDGANMIVTHPGLLNLDVQSPRSVMFWWLLLVLGGVVGTTWMFLRS